MNNAANARKLGYIGSVPGAKNPARDSDSWNTPERYWQAASRCLGGFGLDPFSNAASTITSDRTLTIEDDALTTPWDNNERGSVWMNPPYGRKILDESVGRFVDQFCFGSFDRGIVLINNTTETKAFQLLLKHARAVCLTDHRIKFESPDGKQVTGNTRGQAFFFFDSNLRRRKYLNAFKKEFAQFGTILEVSK